MSTGRGVGGLRGALARSGVYYGWFVVGACFLCGMVCFGTIYSFGVFFEFIQREFQGSYAGTSLIFSVQSIITFGGGAVLGVFVDRYGTRRLLAVGGVLFAGGLFAVGRVNSFVGVVLAYGVVAALGFTVLYVVTYATPPRWFDRRVGIATAVATAGGGIGIMAMPTVSARLIEWFGWRDAYLALMLGFLGLIVLAALLVADHPASVGADATSEFADGGPSVASADLRSQLDAVGNMVTQPSFGLVFAGYVMIFTPAYMLLVHVVEYASTAGIGRGVGVLAIGVIGGMNFLGKFVFGGLSDRVGITAAVVGCATLVGLGTLVLTTLPMEAALLAGVVVFGLGYGGAGALLSPMLADLFGTANINALFGVTSVAFAVTGAVAPVLGGLSFDLTGSFAPGFLLGAVLALLAGPALAIANHVHDPATG